MPEFRLNKRLWAFGARSDFFWQDLNDEIFKECPKSCDGLCYVADNNNNKKQRCAARSRRRTKDRVVSPEETQRFDEDH